MKLFKNLTINQITVILTLFLAGLNLLIFAVLSFSDNRSNLVLWMFLVAASLALSYIVIKFFLEKFVFRKIKLIYKIIHDSKQSIPDGRTLNINDQSLDNVNNEVVEWALKKEEEIEYLTGLENYRRNFVGNISHELKTPIFTIQGYLHTLLDGGLHDEQINEKYLRRAVSNVERLQNIVEDLEIINKLESGNISMDIKPFNLKVLCIEVINDLEIMANERNIQLSLKEGASKSFEVLADRENIRQVLVNLIANSIKYGTEGGRTKIGFYDMDEKILVEVSDNGIGIKEEHLSHLFDRFYRVDTSRSRSQGGSGLGLSIVKHIIEAHKESITVRSTPGLGTTFGFTLSVAG